MVHGNGWPISLLQMFEVWTQGPILQPQPKMCEIWWEPFFMLLPETKRRIPPPPKKMCQHTTFIQLYRMWSESQVYAEHPCMSLLRSCQTATNKKPLIWHIKRFSQASTSCLDLKLVQLGKSTSIYFKVQHTDCISEVIHTNKSKK